MADETKTSEGAAAPAAPERSFARRDRLHDIEKFAQSKWKEADVYATDHTKKPKTCAEDKYMVTFPYPYMNGRLHLGHGFTVTKAEFAVRYHKLKGANALFPFAFHCTGMPIQAAANKLKREIEMYGNPPVFPTEEEEAAAAAAAAAASAGEETVVALGKFKGKKTKAVAKAGGKKQWQILEMMVPADEIPKFVDPMHWLQYFPPYGMEDLKEFGCHIDWRRSFITTEINPFYDKFIRWQFRILNARNRCKFGKRPNIYSVVDGQCCADHDRASGEGVNPQEYTLIKLKVLELPAGHALAGCCPDGSGLTLSLAAATLRPETMYGQTNCFALPEGNYGAYQINDKDVFVISERSAKNLAHQIGGTAGAWGEPKCLATCTGMDLMGLPLSGPYCAYERVYCLPLLTIKMNKGTGVVTSVPSDSPDDWAALRDLQQKEKLREKFHVTEEMVMFDVVPIIDIPGFGSTAALKLCDDLKIKSQNDTEKLKEAKDMVYLKGFYEGVMLVGSQKGKKVCDAKDGVRAELMDAGLAMRYFEPEKPVVGRSGDDCVVAETDQWFLTYGEADWQQRVLEHVRSENFSAYTKQAMDKFEYTLGWLKEWAFSRLYGLGTKCPWQEEFVIESLSDSTIYMAYYTIAHILQGEGNLDGTKLGPRGIKAEDLNDGVFNYIFLNAPSVPEGSAISKELLDEMRAEFEYWYPMDMRVSGKDLITNHLTMSLYNHAEIWRDDPSKWPRSMYANGHVMVDAEKMAKSKGNFLMLKQCCELYGADATRFGCADAGDGMEDSNFARETANATILKLNVELDWAEATLAEEAAGALRAADAPQSTADAGFLNSINALVAECDARFASMEYRLALKAGFSQMLLVRNFYRDQCAKSGAGMHAACVRRFLQCLTLCNAPVVPHWAEQMWAVQGGEGCACNASWPAAEPVDVLVSAQQGYLKSAVEGFNEAMLKAVMPPKAKKGKAAGAAPARPSAARLFVATAFEEWKQEVLGYLSGLWDDAGEESGGAGALPDSKVFMKMLKAHVAGSDSLKPKTKLVMQFAAFVVKTEVPARGRAAFDTTMPFSEMAILGEAMPYIKATLGVEDVVVYDLQGAEAAPGCAKKQANASPGKPSIELYTAA